MDFLALLQQVGFEDAELVADTGFNSSPKTKGVLVRAKKPYDFKPEGDQEAEYITKKFLLHLFEGDCLSPFPLFEFGKVKVCFSFDNIADFNDHLILDDGPV